MELRGGKIILREKSVEDAHLDYFWRSDVEIARLDAAPPLRMTYDEYLRMFNDQLKYPSPASGRFGIHTQNGKYIGNCMYYDLDTINQQAEIGIVIGDKDFWNRGFGSDALATIMGHLFSTTHLERLYLHTLEWNKRAQRAFEKCGFVQVKPVRRNGMDFILMEIKKDRWLEIKEDLELAQNGRTPTQEAE